MYANDSAAPAQDLNESAELDALMQEVWKRAQQEAPQDQAKRGDELHLSPSPPRQGGSDSAGAILSFISPTSAAVAPGLPQTPLNAHESISLGAVSPFLSTAHRSPLAVHNNNNSISHNRNNLFSTASQVSPLMTPMAGISVPPTGSYTQSHVVMTPNSGSGGGVEEEMVFLYGQRQRPPQPSPLFSVPLRSPVEVNGNPSARADSGIAAWPPANAHSAPHDPQRPSPVQVTWSSAHPMAHTTRSTTPPQVSSWTSAVTPDTRSSVKMSSIAAAAASNAWSGEVRDASPSQRRLPPSGPGSATAHPHPQPRPAVAPTAYCTTPRHAAVVTLGSPGRAGSRLGGTPFVAHHPPPPAHGSPARPGSATACGGSPPPVASLPFFATPTSTPSRPPLPRATSFTTSPLTMATAFQVSTGARHASHTAFVSPVMPRSQSRLDGDGAVGGGVPQVHVSGTGPHVDTPPTPSVAPLLALLRGGPAAEATVVHDGAPLSVPAPRAHGTMTSPVREGAAATAARGSPLGIHNSPSHGALSLKERVLRLSQDQVGCRMLQAIVDAEMTSTDPTTTAADLFTSSVAIQQLLEVLMPDIALVMSDSYGNFLVQKLFDVAPPAERKRLLRDSTLSTQLGAVACSCHGTFAVQHLIESMSDEEEEGLVKAALRRSTLQLLMDVNGGHVITKWLAYMRQRYGGLLSSLASTTAAQQAEAVRAANGSPVAVANPHTKVMADAADDVHATRAADALARQLHEKTDFIFDGILDNLMKVCLNRQGCCIVQKMCDYWSAMSIPTPLSLPEDTAVDGAVAAHEASTALQRTPVRVVQAAAAAGGSRESLQRFVTALLDHVLELAVDPYGNYVLTHAVKLCYVKGYLQLVDAIAGCLLQPEAPNATACVQRVVRLCRSKFASNVVEQVLRLCGEKRVRAFCRLLLHVGSNSEAEAPVTASDSPSSTSRPFLAPVSWNRVHADPHSTAAAGGMKSVSVPSLPLLDIAMDPYGNYVVQTLLTVAPVNELVTTLPDDAGKAVGGILPVLQEALPQLRDKNFGRKMETKVGLAQLRVSQSANE